MGTNGAKDDVLNPITLHNTIGGELEDILRTNEKNKVDFEKFMGWENRDFSSIKKLSKADISKISVYLNLDGLVKYLHNFQEDYRVMEKKALFDYNRNKKLFAKLKGVRRMLNGEYTEGLDVLDDISCFFGIEDEHEICQKAEEVIALYRTANFNPDSLNLFAWMRRGELDFRKLSILHYDREALLKWIGEAKWKDRLTDTGYFKILPGIFRKFGVGLVFTPYLDKTVYGAVRWFEGIPLIQLSDREKKLAVCWYTLFHEIGHVLLHENDTIFEGEINEPKSIASQKEVEANAYAYANLFNGDELRKYIFGQRGKVIHDGFISDTAKKFNTSDMFVAYWMFKAQIGGGIVHNYIPKLTFDNVT
jgi:hypothetical protein